jgi:hypothetical protein
MLFGDYAIVPDVFDVSCYSHEDVADLHLQHLKEVLLSEGVVRDLYAGAWSIAIFERREFFHRRGLELLRKLKTQNRLYQSAGVLGVVPASYSDWCQEALASHHQERLTGIFTQNDTAACFREAPDQEMLGVIGRLDRSAWWTRRDNSIRLRRVIADYLNHLSLILSQSNSLMFIDPHLDPNKRGYWDFIELLKESGRGGKNPAIEIHRVCYEGSGPNRRIIQPAEWERTFKESMSAELARLGITVEVYIWDDFHDRYLVTDLVGIFMGNGFDVNSNAETRWIRLSRQARDDVQREFDSNSTIHRLHRRFPIP